MAESSDKNNFSILVTRICAVLLLVLVVILAGMWFMPQINRLNTLQGNKNALEQQNKSIEANINELKMKQERLETDPEFSERVAHSEGLVSPDETVFKVTNETQNTPKPQPKKAAKQPARPAR